MIGCEWTAGNRLELSDPNGRWSMRPKDAVYEFVMVSAVVSRRRDAVNDSGACGVPVAESVLAPPGPIPNPVVTQYSAGEYCSGDAVGGEAAAGTSQVLESERTTRHLVAGWSSGSSLGS